MGYLSKEIWEVIGILHAEMDENDSSCEIQLGKKYWAAVYDSLKTVQILFTQAGFQKVRHDMPSQSSLVVMRREQLVFLLTITTV